MKRAPWPKDDGRWLPKGQRRVRLYFICVGSAVLNVRMSLSAAQNILSLHPADARIRRAVASVRWVDA